MAKDNFKDHLRDDSSDIEDFSLEPWENDLQSILFRFDCPTPLELGEYTLASCRGKMPEELIAAIEAHIAQCPYCKDEVEAAKALKGRGFPEQKIAFEGETGKILPFRQEVSYFETEESDYPKASGFRGKEGPKGPKSNKIAIKIDEKQSLNMYYRLTQEGSDFTLYGQFLPEDQINLKLEDSHLEIWQGKEIRCYHNMDELLAFQCRIPELSPVNIRVSSSEGTWLAFKLDLDR
ncbi:MAG: hypothetical protein JXR70_08525 [Spirochaetales bacterium]|nr:hypothetical protein [Spirochaetales bacterium]